MRCVLRVHVLQRKFIVIKRGKFQNIEIPVTRWRQAGLQFDCGIQWLDSLELPPSHQDFVFSQHDLLSCRRPGLLHRDFYLDLHGAWGNLLYKTKCLMNAFVKAFWGMLSTFRALFISKVPLGYLSKVLIKVNLRPDFGVECTGYLAKWAHHFVQSRFSYYTSHGINVMQLQSLVVFFHVSVACGNRTKCLWDEIEVTTEC